MPVNMKLKNQEVYISRLNGLLDLLNLNGTVKTKLAMLAFFYCEEFVKNSYKPIHTCFCRDGSKETSTCAKQICYKKDCHEIASTVHRDCWSLKGITDLYNFCS